MISWHELAPFPLEKKVSLLYEHGHFIMSIRYYKQKINLYLLGDEYVEVFVNHKQNIIERIAPLDRTHSRMKFYSDQIKLPTDI